MSDAQAQAGTRRYLGIFAVQLILTGIAIGVAVIPDHPHGIFVALLGIMVVNAAWVALNFMHLGQEAPGLRRMVSLPLILLVVYAIALTLEAAWRHFQ